MVIIRTKDIWNAEKELKILKQKAKTLETSINESYKDQDDVETGFEYAILDAHITADEIRLDTLNEQIKEKEHALKVLRGEAEPVIKKHWEKDRPEQRLEAFLGVV